jgi:hypothetical protein
MLVRPSVVVAEATRGRWAALCGLRERFVFCPPDAKPHPSVATGASSNGSGVVSYKAAIAYSGEVYR